MKAENKMKEQSYKSHIFAAVMLFVMDNAPVLQTRKLFACVFVKRSFLYSIYFTYYTNFKICFYL